jgi:L-iditol 2-dehydrogenase
MPTDVGALVLSKPGSLALETRRCGEPGPDEVIVAPRVVGICGSDLHLYREGRIGDSVVQAPLVLGHEAAGIVSAVGSDVGDLKVGDRVIVEPGLACGRCRLCVLGRYNLCSQVSFLGIPPTDGLMADLVRVPRRWIHRLPDALTDAEGAMIEPFAVGLQAVEEAGVGPGQSVAILGAGPIGLMILQAARVRGAAAIVSIDLAEPALAMARRLGATEIVNPRERDVGEVVRAVAGGDGVDVVIEAVGAAATIRQTLELVRRGGVVTLVGIASEPAVPFNVNHVVRRGIQVRPSFRYAHQHPTAISLVAQRRVDLLSPITHRFPFREAVDGFGFVDQHKAEVIKGVIELGFR